MDLLKFRTDFNFYCRFQSKQITYTTAFTIIKVIKNVSFIKPSFKRGSNDFSFPIFSQLFDYLRRHAWVVVHFWEYDKMEVKLSTLKWVRRKFLNTILFQENFPLTPTLIYFCIDMGAERRGGIRCFYFTISRIPNIG